jgi:hypothetical protein
VHEVLRQQEAVSTAAFLDGTKVDALRRHSRTRLKDAISAQTQQAISAHLTIRSGLVLKNHPRKVLS